jgi:hypothetical protein
MMEEELMLQWKNKFLYAKIHLYQQYMNINDESQTTYTAFGKYVQAYSNYMHFSSLV